MSLFVVVILMTLLIPVLIIVYEGNKQDFIYIKGAKIHYKYCRLVAFVFVGGWFGLVLSLLQRKFFVIQVPAIIFIGICAFLGLLIGNKYKNGRKNKAK